MSKFLLNRPDSLYKIELIVPLNLSDKLLSELRNIENIHLEKVEEKEIEEIKKEIEEVKRLLDNIRFIMSKSGRKIVDVQLTSLEIKNYSIQKIKQDLEPINQKVILLDTRLRELENQRKKLLELHSYVKLLPDHLSTSLIVNKGKIYSSLLVAGKRDVMSKTIEELKKYKIVTVPLYESEDVCVYSIIYLSSIDADVKNALHFAGLYYVSDEHYEIISKQSTSKELKELLEKELNKLQASIEEITREIIEISSKNIDWLSKYYLYLDNHFNHLSDLQKLIYLKHLSVIRGWIPSDRVEELREYLDELQIPYYLSVKEPSKNDYPPTKLSNITPINNFELITELYGTPNYWEWDPTPLVAYSFAFFYGMMVSDIAYSLFGSLLILLFLDKFVLDKESPSYKKFKRILLISNSVALLFGLTTGTFLGNFLQEFFGINLPVLIDFMTSPINFIEISLIIGLIHVNIAHVLTLIKAIRNRDKPIVIQETGIFGIQIFGIPLILRLFFDYDVPGFVNLSNDLLMTGAIFNMVLIIVSNLMTMRFLGLMTWIFQITGILGDVLSYVRLAGVGLATFYIAFSFNFIISMLLSWVSSTNNIVIVGIGGLLSILLLSFTHLVSLVLSILGGFVHSLRLCFLEFLSKFYDGNGTPFSPLRVVLSRKIIITPS